MMICFGTDDLVFPIFGTIFLHLLRCYDSDLSLDKTVHCHKMRPHLATSNNSDSCQLATSHLVTDTYSHRNIPEYVHTYVHIYVYIYVHIYIITDNRCYPYDW